MGQLAAPLSSNGAGTSGANGVMTACSRAGELPRLRTETVRVARHHCTQRSKSRRGGESAISAPREPPPPFARRGRALRRRMGDGCSGPVSEPTDSSAAAAVLREASRAPTYAASGHTAPAAAVALLSSASAWSVVTARHYSLLFS